MRRTKIVCTIGPASNSEEMLKKLIRSGMNVARLNFSHGSHEYHQATLDRIKKVRREMEVPLKKGECAVIPAHTDGCMIFSAKDTRLLWLTVDGPLTESFMRQMNAYNRVPAKQGMLPSMVILMRQIVQVLVRHTGTSDASFQLEQLLWGLIAAHSGQSVATSATLSHEIARVVDALRACRYRDAFSLADMAAISR